MTNEDRARELQPTPAPAAVWVTCLESGCDKPISAYSCMLAGESANACTEHRCRCKHNIRPPAEQEPAVKFFYVRCSGCGAEVKWPADERNKPGSLVIALCAKCSGKLQPKESS